MSIPTYSPVSYTHLDVYKRQVPPLTTEALVPVAAAYPSVMDNPPLSARTLSHRFKNRKGKSTDTCLEAGENK